MSLFRRLAFERCPRHFSRQTHSFINDFTSSLCRTQPSFPISPKDVRVLTQPSEFYTLLLDMIQKAERRIFISSLYIGSEETELIDALEASLRSKPLLRLRLVLDLNRSTRPGPSSTARILLPILKKFPNRVDVSFFRSPSLRGILAKVVPPRFNEGWGTWHAKMYGVDDQVMISGANLNRSYFTNRQDRYLHFHSAMLAQYCFDYLKTAATFSYKMHIDSEDTYALYWPDPSVHPHHIELKVEAAFRRLQTSYHAKSMTGEINVIPIIQGGQFNVNEEVSAVNLLFNMLEGRSVVDMTTGYFGLYKSYQDLILERRDIDCRIIASSPKANGFYGSRGLSGRIPEGYTLLEQRFMKAVKDAGREEDVVLEEWAKLGWTYHAKGLWVYPDDKSLPLITLFGSTNLNSRSATIDTELSFVMTIPPNTTDAMDLRQNLANEMQNIRKDAIPWEGGSREVRVGTKALVGLVEGML